MSDLDKFFGPSQAHESARRAIPAQEHTPPKRKISPQVIKRRGEKWTKDYMKRLAGIYVVKRSDAPVVLPDGKEYTPKGLDMYGSVLPKDHPFAWRVEVEVKTFTDSFGLSALKKHQVEMLYSSRERGEIAILALVEHEKGAVSRMWWLLWPRERGEQHYTVVVKPGTASESLIDIPTFSWLMAELRRKAEVDARFHAKSIRQVDLGMMNQFLVAKVGGQWQLSPTHWLRGLLDIPVKQGRLL